MVPLDVNSKTVAAVVDTGAEVTLVNTEVFNKTGWEGEREPVILKGIFPEVAEGCMVKDVPLKLGGKDYKWDLYVAPISDAFLLGLDFMLEHKVDPLISKSALSVDGVEIPAFFGTSRSPNDVLVHEVGQVSVGRRVVVPPHSVCRVIGKVQSNLKGTCMLIPNCPNDTVAIPYTAVNVHDKTIPIQVTNLSDSFITLKKDSPLGSLEEVSVLEGFEPAVQNIRATTVDPIPNQDDSATEGLKDSPVDEFPESLDPLSIQEELQTVQDQMPAYIKDMFMQSCDNLTDEQSINFGKVLIEYADIFAKDDTDLGLFTSVQHSMNTGDADPIKQRMRKVPKAFADEEESHLQKMLDCGVIEPSNSAWASPSVLIRKKDGSIRWCIDYREVNAVTKKDAYPLPLIEECLDALEGTQFMSTLDLQSGYWQIEMKPEDRPKTAFVTKYGLYEFCRMPFGLCNAPATFQRAMQLVFRGMTWREVLTYIDDLNIMGKDFEDHLQNLVKSFGRLQQYHLKLKPRKCHFFKTEVPFLGRLATINGIAVDPKKIAAVVEWPVPFCKKEVESFLGFTNYHRNHIKEYAHKATPLYELTGSKAEFHWEESQQQSFEALQLALICAPVLAYPNSKDPFILDTDASDFAIGAELLQVQEGEERVVSYGSFSLIPSQRNYCTTRKELLAVLRFTREYRHYLLGRSFIVRTDHSSLTWLMRFKNAEGMIARWLEELSQYDMIIQHRPGKKHGNADGLSCCFEGMDYCDCYNAGSELASLSCGRCKFCTKSMYSAWKC